LNKNDYENKKALFDRLKKEKTTHRSVFVNKKLNHIGTGINSFIEDDDVE
jgi:hypothetical protein